MQEISCRWELDDADGIIHICKHKNDDKSQFCFANSLEPIGTYVPKSLLLLLPLLLLLLLLNDDEDDTSTTTAATDAATSTE